MNTKSTAVDLRSLFLYAMIISTAALSLDITLPIYNEIAEAFLVENQNELQKVVLIFIFGMFFGELFLGFMSDVFGRRIIMLVSISIYIVGTIYCLFSDNFFSLLLGRWLQGVGAAGQKICIRAILRDNYSGNQMAKISSQLTLVFIFVPFIAPYLGLKLNDIGSWPAVFAFLTIFGFICILWFFKQQVETLNTANKNKVKIKSVGKVFCSFLLNTKSMGYTIVAGLMFGIHLSFISMASIYFADLFEIVDLFPTYFGLLSLAFGIALLINSKLVIDLGMSKLTQLALTMIIIVGVVGICAEYLTATVNLFTFFTLIFILLFCIGIVFGNIIAMIMEPLGKVAGLGGAFSSSISTLLALGVSSLVGKTFDGDLLSLFIAIFLCGCISFIICVVAKKKPLCEISY